MNARRFVLIGHPVGHSISPAIHRAAYAALGLGGHSYEAVDCPDEGAVRVQVDAVASGAVVGANVTVPHKRLALTLATKADASASEVGAANVLARAPGGGVAASNTDVVALVQEIQRLRPGARRAVVIGGGGAARAVVVACRRLDVACTVAARSFGTTEAAEAMDAFRELGTEPVRLADVPGSAFAEAIRSADVIVQATSAGMQGADPGESVSDIVPWSEVPRAAVAYDLVYNPSDTPFLLAAQRHGLRVAGGLGMLVEQAAAALELWLGISAPRAAMADAASRALRDRSPR